MNLLAQYNDVSQAESLQYELRKRGVLTHVSSSNSFRLSSAQTGAVKVGLWAVIDEQYSDSMSYLRDSNHKITTVLTEEQMRQLETEFAEAQSKAGKKTLEKALAIIVGAFLLGFIGYVGYGALYVA